MTDQPEQTHEFRCAVCDQPSTTGPLDPESATAFADAVAAGRDIVCDGCVVAIAAGVCGAERQGYACLRPEGHTEDDRWHASRSGEYMVTWSEQSRGVKLRKWPEGVTL